MHPEWHNVRRLLCCFATATTGVSNRRATSALEPALQMLRQLPDTELVLLSQTASNSDTQWSLTSLTSSQPVIRQFTATFTNMIEMLRSYSFDAALVLSPPCYSPYTLGYLCYLAGIPIRVGQSQEFGGGVLSFCVVPPLDPVPLSDYYLHLLDAAGLRL
jgi:hypothetical protein